MAYGLTVEEASGPPVELWPDSVVPVNIFCELVTQWRVGPNGPVGLDYNVVFHKLDRMRLKRREYERIESAIRIMADEAMTFLWNKRKQG